MDTPLQPGNRPRSALLAVLVAIGVVAVASFAIAIGSTEQAGAAGLERFESCEDLEAWGADADRPSGMGDVFGGGDVAVAREGDVAATSVAPASPTADAENTASGSAALDETADESGAGATNVVVAGVDELDLVDRVGDRRVLVAGTSSLALVDLAAGEVLARTTLPYGAQITFDAEADVAWVVGQSTDGAEVVVRRIAVGEDALADDGSWSSSGMLVDARRVGDRLYVVAADGAWGTEGASIPFPEGPVPCDQVLHPVSQTGATATLLVSLPVDGPLEPEHSAEVVGSGQLVNVTDDAAYLATPTWEGEPRTGIHRFDLADLTHTGSGTVPGMLLNDFSMSEQDGYLRVAITQEDPTPPMDDVIIDDFPEPPATITSDAGGAASAGNPGEAPTEPETTLAPTTTEPELAPPDTTVPDTTPPESTVPAPTEPPVPPETIVPSPTVVPTTPPEPGEGKNQVIVLETKGDLDVVGETKAFGHPGERLEGIRFDGDTAYAVTFLQTDPFYVLDLADPTDPKVAGEVQLPGFSSYLHPVGDGKVVGFGPDETGRAAAKLFDVSDPSAPAVVGSVVLGDQSPVVDDHHAFVDLGDGRFAVPVTSWMAYAECGGPAVDCVVPPTTETTTPVEVVTLEVDGDELVEVERVATDELRDGAVRAIPDEDGWGVLSPSRLVLLDGDGETRASLALD